MNDVKNDSKNENDNEGSTEERAPAKRGDRKALWMLVAFCLGLTLMIAFNMR